MEELDVMDRLWVKVDLAIADGGIGMRVHDRNLREWGDEDKKRREPCGPLHCVRYGVLVRGRSRSRRLESFELLPSYRLAGCPAIGFALAVDREALRGYPLAQ